VKKSNLVGTNGSGSGSASLAGYEYQIDVSVWLALDLVLISRLTEELVLEPASQEDLEATLSDVEPGRLVSRVPMTGYTLFVQAKRRGGDAWTPTTLKSLLKHGGDKRISAAERLKDIGARYLLVTSAGVNGDARKLNRRQAGSWPKASAMPNVIAKDIDHDISGRVAVIANQDDERLRGDIDRLLAEGCRVPNARLSVCRSKLRDEARTRIARAGGGRWRRRDIETIIREHEGYLASAPELEHYVHPNNWGDLRAAMAKESAAIIIGQSGTGKTLATKVLYDELRKAIPGLTRMPIRLGPSQLRDDTTPPPVLYDIEDPWGRFDFDPNSRPWNDQLGDFLAAARPDSMIIATSRLDVAQAAGVLPTIKPWVVGLEAENYGKVERQKLYRSRIDSLPRDLRPLARGSERQVLDNLATPLEIQKFFDALRTQDREGLKNPPGFVGAAIDRAHQDSIELTVIEQIEGRRDLRAAAIMWALLAANDKVTRSVLREIEDSLADMDAAMERGVSPLVDFFVAARNFRQSDGGIVTYYHPRVEAGITRALEKNRQIVRRTLRQLIDLLVSADGPGEEWGAGAAARILSRARSKFGVNPTDSAAPRIDDWLEARVAAGGREFGEYLELAASAGSAASNASEVARFLLHRPNRSFGGMLSWGRQKKGADWYRARAANPATKPLVETFIRTILPQDRVHYPTSLADELAQLSPDLTPAFLDAAAEAVYYGYIASDDVIAHGALNDIEGFEAIVNSAVSVLTPSEKELREAAETHLDIVNDVYSDDYAQHISENDDGYTASEFLKAYVGRVRREKGWRLVAQHPHAEKLRSYWLRALGDEAREGPVDGEEMAGAFQAGYGTKDEDDLWVALLKQWDPKYSRPLAARLVEGASDGDVDQAALTCLIERHPNLLSEVIADLVERGAAGRLVVLSSGIAYLRRGRSRDGAKHVAAAEAATAQLPEPFAEICEAEIALDNKEAPVLSSAARDVLANIPDPSDAVRTLRLELRASNVLRVEDDIRWGLETSEDSGTAVLAIEAAIRKKLSNEVEAALDHRFAHVAARALTSIAIPLSAPLPSRLLNFAAHRASPVRRALVDVLKAKPNRAHQATLIQLASDQWSKSSMHYGQDSDDYPIAQTAVDALADLAPLGGTDDEAIVAIAIDTSDPDVRNAIFRLLAKTGGLAMQNRLFDISVEPGRAHVRSSAAHAMLQAAEQLDPAIIDKITPRLLATRYEPVAGVLAILIAWRGEIASIRTAAEEIATNAKRRVLLLLIVWVLKDRDQQVAEEIAAMLPANHKAVAWALGGELVNVDDSMIADLGDHPVCAEVLKYMKLKSGTNRQKSKKSPSRR
jgi:hypothetical protein